MAQVSSAEPVPEFVGWDAGPEHAPHPIAVSDVDDEQAALV